MNQKTHITVNALPIRLGQFLKLANMVQDGFEAKMRIQDGEVYVNGQLETRRGKQLAEHDEVRLDTVTAVVEIDVD